MSNKLNLVVCDIYNKFIHGYDENSYDTVKGHYLCMYVSRKWNISDNTDIDEEYEDEYDDENDNEYDDENDNNDNNNNYDNQMNDMVELYSAYYLNYVRNPDRRHDFIRNYREIISKTNYIQPHLAKVMNLPSGEYVAIIKTMWLKIIQRAWKRLLKKRKYIISKRKTPQAIWFREIHGKWPQHCEHYPLVNGMFWK